MKKTSPTLEALEVLHTLVREKNLSATAARRGLSVPKASRILSELRDFFEDELFVRGRSGFVPTQRALDLQPLIERLLADYEALAPDPVLDIPSVERVVRIGCVDNALYNFAPEAIRFIHEAAPRVMLDFQPIDDSRFEKLRNGELDLLISPLENFPNEDFHALDLKRNEFVVCCACDHPLFLRQQETGAPATNEELVRYPFIDVTMQFFRRNVSTLRELVFSEIAAAPSAVRTRYFLPLFGALSGTELLMIVPKFTALDLNRKTCGREFGILLTESKPLSNTAKLVWHRRTHVDPVMQWVRGAIVSSAGGAEI